MRTTIDKAGRVVIPASIRAKLGLEPGTAFEILVEESSIRLVRAVSGPKLVRLRHRWVARPTVPANRLPKVDVARLVRETRDRLPW